MNRLRDVREDRDLNQEAIAKVLKIDQSSYAKYERGLHKMGIDKYMILAEYYNISIDYLCGLLQTPRELRKGKN